ncbi:MAG: hypothetical protein M3N13_00885, partial [Candidatus Eremiobacteraeota bacterium]|nr:hypothetical protein [Candidatus Eremiobacteraeota bacterium]
VWDLHEGPPHSVTPDLPISAVEHDTPRIPQGALVVPGTYTVTLQADGISQTRPLKVALDPRITMSAQALAQQYAMAHDVATLLDTTFSDMLRAKQQNNMKTVANLGRLNAELSALIDLIDGVDGPVTQGTRQGYCEVTSETRRALGEHLMANACGKEGRTSP